MSEPGCSLPLGSAGGYGSYGLYISFRQCCFVDAWHRRMRFLQPACMQPTCKINAVDSFDFQLHAEQLAGGLRRVCERDGSEALREAAH